MGYSALTVALVASIISFISFIYYNRKQDESLYNFSRIALLVQTLMLTAAIAILLYYFLSRDFNVEYVASYSDRSLPLAYTISALWAGASGSLLLWAWVLSLFTIAIAFRESKDKMTGYALTILISVNIFLVFLLVSYNDPFVRLSFTPEDGGGLNPLLVDLGMVIHPPTLFIGYAGLMVPFAYAIGGLLSENDLWVYRLRRWTLIGWLFIGLGIFLGGWWSYTVLGWGGYWAWDPVENSSLVPWLLSSALLHNVVLQERKRGMKLWTVLLSIGTFVTVILATFLTRSGLISSVHAFGESEIGLILASYLAVMLVASLAILAFKYDQVKSMNIFQSFLGREASFLLNNLLFVIIGLIVVWGTLFPMLNEALTGSKIGVDPGFYNAIAPWVILFLVVLMGICIILRWGSTSSDELISKLKYSVILAALSIPVTFLLGFNNISSLIGIAAFVFAVSLHLEDYILDAKNFAKKKGISIISSIFRVLVVKRRKYGGYIVHFSMLLIFIGLIGTNIYQATYTANLPLDTPVEIGGYAFTYQGISVSEKLNQIDYTANLLVQKGNFVDTLTARLTDDFKTQSTVVHVGVLSLPFEDIYVIPEALYQDQVSVTIDYNPLINFIWIGGPIMLIGTLLGLLPRRFGTS